MAFSSITNIYNITLVLLQLRIVYIILSLVTLGDKILLLSSYLKTYFNVNN